jgi:hypothetical protein
VKTTISGVNLGGGFGFENYAGNTVNACSYGVYISGSATKYQLLNNIIPAALVNTTVSDNGAVAGTSLKRLINNVGFNEFSGPIVNTPANSTTLTNPYGRPCWVTVVGGTVTVVNINGSTMYSSTGVSFVMNAGDTLFLAYSVAPTVTWWPK